LGIQQPHGDDLVRSGLHSLIDEFEFVVLDVGAGGGDRSSHGKADERALQGTRVARRLHFGFLNCLWSAAKSGMRYPRGLKATRSNRAREAPIRPEFEEDAREADDP